MALSAASAVASAARTPATALVRAEGFVGPDATVFRVAGFRLLRVFSEYLGIDTTTTGSCRRPCQHSHRIFGRQSRSGVEYGEAGGTLLVAERVVRRANARVLNWKRRAARAERTGVHGVVPDNVLRNPVTAAFAVGSSPAIGRATAATQIHANGSDARMSSLLHRSRCPGRCPGGAAGEDAWSMVGTDRKAGHASLLWESVIAHLGLSVRPRWLPDTRDDHDLCGGLSGLIAALTASASSRLTGHPWSLELASCRPLYGSQRVG